MAQRNCAQCGRDKDLSRGKVCEKGHFICKDCVYKGSNFFFLEEKKKCPVCSKRLN